MKPWLLLAVLSTALLSVNTQVVFYRTFDRIPSLISDLTDLDYSNQDDPYAPLEEDNQEITAQYGDAQGRRKTFPSGGGAAQSRQGDDVLGTIGGDFDVNSFSNPFLGFKRDIYRPRTKTVVVPPVCVACKCLVGFRSCAEAGGRQWVPGVCFANTNVTAVVVGNECSYPSPTSLSACDSTCVRTCLVRVAGTAPALTDCMPVDTVSKRQCTSPCENLARGSIVKCNSAYPEVISNVPSPCNNQYNYRYKRQPSIARVVVEGAAETPEIQSSHESPSDRRGRFFKFVLPVPTPRLNVEPITNFVRGVVTATYVAADGVCLPGDFASAPLCN